MQNGRSWVCTSPARRLALAAALLASLAKAAPARASDAPDTVILTNGQRIRGVVTQADPERGTTIVLPDGTVRKFRPSEVARVAFEDRGASARPTPEKPDRPEPKPEKAPPKRDETKPVARYEAPDDEPAPAPRPARRIGLRLGLQVQGGPFFVTGLPQSSIGGQGGLAARFGYQFDPTFGLHWEPAASFGADDTRSTTVVWNTLLGDIQIGQFFLAGGPGLAAVWQFNPRSTQELSFGAVVRMGIDIPLQRRGGSNLTVGVEGRIALVSNGTFLFPGLTIGYDLN